MKNGYYRYVWGNNPKRANMKGRICYLVATGKMGSALVDFIDTTPWTREIVSRRALRWHSRLHPNCRRYEDGEYLP
jgi:hypothetical protein